MENNQQTKQPQSTAQKPEKRPDDVGSVAVEGFIKIFDPNTRKVYVEQQA
jgi:hypothetical protein